MFVAVIKIRIMRMFVSQVLMPVNVGMGFSHFAFMLMPMVQVMMT